MQRLWSCNHFWWCIYYLWYWFVLAFFDLIFEQFVYCLLIASFQVLHQFLFDEWNYSVTWSLWLHSNLLHMNLLHSNLCWSFDIWLLSSISILAASEWHSRNIQSNQIEISIALNIILKCISIYINILNIEYKLMNIHSTYHHINLLNDSTFEYQLVKLIPVKLHLLESVFDQHQFSRLQMESSPRPFIFVDVWFWW